MTSTPETADPKRRSCAICGFWSRSRPPLGECLRHAYGRFRANMTRGTPGPVCPAPATSADDTCNRWATDEEASAFVDGGPIPKSWPVTAHYMKDTVVITPAGVDALHLHHRSRERVPMWVINAHPPEFPHGYVARFILSLPQPEPTLWAIFAPTLEALRAALPEGLHALARNEGDEPQIVETWL